MELADVLVVKANYCYLLSHGCFGVSRLLWFSDWYSNIFWCSGNPKDEPGAIVCRVAKSFLRFGSYQLHASRGKEDLQIVRALADYAIKQHFPHIQNMDRSDTLSFSTGGEDDSVVDLTSNKYAGMQKVHIVTC